MYRKHARYLLVNENVFLLANDSTFNSPVNNFSTSFNDKQTQFLQNKNVMALLNLSGSITISHMFIYNVNTCLETIFNSSFEHSFSETRVISGYINSSFKCNSKKSSQILECRNSRFRVYILKNPKLKKEKHNAIVT